tara:strand:- start:249 stop:866 length:618 start_codon:yes stop_codon:yes gene_type:complete
MSSYSGRFISNERTLPNLDTNNKMQDFTLKQLSGYNKSDTCLIGVNGKVYNITKYKKSLDNGNTNINLNLKCGKNYNNVNEANIFKNNFTGYKDYQIGNIKYYNQMIILNILLKIVIVGLFIAAYRYTNNFYVLLPLLVYLLINIYIFYYNFWEKQKSVNTRLQEINPNLVKNNNSNRFSDKIYKELNKDINNMLYGVDSVEEIQ